MFREETPAEGFLNWDDEEKTVIIITKLILEMQMTVRGRAYSTAETCCKVSRC